MSGPGRSLTFAVRTDCFGELVPEDAAYVAFVARMLDADVVVRPVEWDPRMPLDDERPGIAARASLTTTRTGPADGRGER